MKKVSLLLTLCFLFFSTFVFATITTVSFSTPVPTAPSSCNDSWTESGVPLQVVPIPPDTGCYFDYPGTGELWLFPARLTANLSGLGMITKIEIDIIDYCSIGCTSVGIMNGTSTVQSFANTSIGSPETFVFDNTNAATITGLFMESFEGLIDEIRITHNAAAPATVNCNVVVPFDTALPTVPTNCNDTWVENSVPQQIVPITTGGICSPTFANGKLLLAPGRLVMDLSSLSNITRIEIDIDDNCGAACTTAEVRANSTAIALFSNAVGGVETFVFINSNNEPVDELFIKSSEGFVLEVRYYLETGECSGELNLTGGILPIGLYTACGNLFSANELAGTTDFISSAGIFLEPGFLAAENTDFRASIDVNYCSSSVPFIEPILDDFKTTKSFEHFKILENPSSTSLNLLLNFEKSSIVDITLHDANGVLIKTLVNHQRMASGIQHISYQLENVSSGIYFVTLWENGIPSTHQLSVVN